MRNITSKFEFLHFCRESGDNGRFDRVCHAPIVLRMLALAVTQVTSLRPLRLQPSDRVFEVRGSSSLAHKLR